MRTRFRGITARQVHLVRGPVGWGEFAPFVEYEVAEARQWWHAAVEASTIGWPAAVRDRVPVNTTVPAVDAATAHRLVAASGCSTAKVKVAEPGQTLADEQARLEAVRDAIGPAGRIRIDANGLWDVPTALTRLPLLDAAAGGLEYVEQPVMAVHDLAEVRRRQAVPVAADESIRRAADPLAVARAQAADVVVLKVAPLGGVAACLRLAEQVGLPVVVSSALDTSVGIAAGVALAAALPELPYACGLGTVTMFTADVARPPLVPDGGFIDVAAALAVTPDEEAMAALAADEATAQWWASRVAAVSR